MFDCTYPSGYYMCNRIIVSLYLLTVTVHMSVSTLLLKSLTLLYDCTYHIHVGPMQMYRHGKGRNTHGA